MKRHIPNMLTCCNLLAGCAATVHALYGDAYLSLAFIVVGAVFDFFDGMTARLLGVSSPIGKELDSLADVVTFGVAPSSLVFMQLFILNAPGLLPFAAYLIAAFSALRLAKFNLDERQTTSFIGLPTPANALFWGALIAGAARWENLFAHTWVFILALIAASCYLLTAELPLFALKFKHWRWRGNELRYTFMLTCLPLLLLFRELGLSLIVIWYILLSCLENRRH